MSLGASKFRLAAVGDLHCREPDHGRFRDLVKSVNAEADALLLAGDLTDRGLLDEATTLGEALSGLTVPCVAVLGNHDCESGAVKEITKLLHDLRVQVLDGDHTVLENEVGVAGIKGFCGGFDNAMLQAFGEGVIKTFVQETVSEALKLEAALGQLDCAKKVVVMHYAPIAETTEGEIPEVRPYLGSSRFSVAVDQYGADAVFHGHAHHGKPQGKTPKGIPVYNVALPLLRRVADVRYLLIEL
jgi:Icc-related predicted phosphoesterase